MNNIIRKITAMIGAVVISTASIGTISSNASTTYYSWSVNNSYSKSKQDTSSLRVRNYSNSYVHLDVSGYNSYGSVDVAHYNGQTLTVTGITIPGNSNRRVKQFVKENNGTYAVVYFYSNSNAGYGEWSADSPSSCTYQFANP